jgi:hypothetical protein
MAGSIFDYLIVIERSRTNGARLDFCLLDGLNTPILAWKIYVVINKKMNGSFDQFGMQKQ